VTTDNQVQMSRC